MAFTTLYIIRRTARRMPSTCNTARNLSLARTTAHCEDNTLQMKLALMDTSEGFPVALGVIRDVPAPTYNNAIWKQIDDVKQKKNYHNFSELLETNDIWEVK